jgi:hypothetical protein
LLKWLIPLLLAPIVALAQDRVPPSAFDLMRERVAACDAQNQYLIDVILTMKADEKQTAAWWAKVWEDLPK